MIVAFTKQEEKEQIDVALVVRLGGDLNSPHRSSGRLPLGDDLVPKNVR